MGDGSPNRNSIKTAVLNTLSTLAVHRTVSCTRELRSNITNLLSIDATFTLANSTASRGPVNLAPCHFLQVSQSWLGRVVRLPATPLAIKWMIETCLNGIVNESER